MSTRIYVSVKNLLRICNSKPILARAAAARLAPDPQLQPLHEPEVRLWGGQAPRSQRFCTGPDSGARDICVARVTLQGVSRQCCE